MHTRSVTLTLTEAEARALALAAGNTLTSEEDARQVLAHHNQVKAAYRALDKLRDALGHEPAEEARP